jgi:hypothetical protein
MALPSTWSPGRIAGVVVTLALVVFWAWIFAGGPRADPPDTLDSEVFPAAAQDRCEEAVAFIEGLPAAAGSESAADRADVLDQANAALRDLLTDLGRLEVPDVGDDRRFVNAWLADWATYVEDREDFADALRDDPDAELLITGRGGRQITVTIDNLARVNDMDDCMVPLDA